MSIRTPLRPLARILQARSTGENPDAIERENLRLRRETMRDATRLRAEGRLLVLGLCFVSAFAVVGMRMGQVAASNPEEPRAVTTGTAILAQRADILDRNGRILATNRTTHSLYAQPHEMVDPVHAAKELAKIFPDMDEARLIKDFTGTRKFVWIQKQLAPEQQQAVHDIGEPGLLFGPRESRLYPNGKLAAHILGGTKFGREGVMSAEIVGQSGIERYSDDYLRDPANGDKPLQLSIDLSVQSTMREVLFGGMHLLGAKGAAAILMDVHTGELISMVSLPDFDPNSRPTFAGQNAGDNPRFSRAVQGVYELGSTFKIFAAAQGMELGLFKPDSMVAATPPFRWGKHKIGEFEGHNYGPYVSLTDMIVKSSNVATAHVAQQIGVDRQKSFLKSLGFFDPTPVELIEAKGAKPLLPPHWSELSTITIGFGHGLSASPLHLATAYSSLLNGGTRVTPTLLKHEGPIKLGPRIVSPEVSAASRQMLRAVVGEGTASFGDVRGYQVAGKTGTADKPREDGKGYYKDKTITTFASVFPANEPKYVLVVTLDEAVETTGPKPRRTAGWTAVPVAAEVIRRVAPILGIRPDIETLALGQ
ncbi:MAG: penicillin-binding protein 2 [Pacificibacter sp.]|uniref:peptidoglycan D,D-transpeptidase FtsI family protein n=1 Tax=Pacificibacter sp. TaxID=1917866 RepID=UPI0032194093